MVIFKRSARQSPSKCRGRGMVDEPLGLSRHFSNLALLEPRRFGMSGFNRLPLGWRLIVILGLLAGLGQLGWAAFGGPGLVSPFSMAGMATLVATLVIGLVAWAEATRRAFDGLTRSVDA